MADDSGATPLPRRVPGATVPPRPPVRVERLVIPEDLRQRLLTAIADELQRDEAQAGRSAQDQGNTEQPAGPGDRGTAWWRDEAAAQAGASGPAGLPAPAPDQAASAPTVWSPVPRPAGVPAPDSDEAAASAPTVWSPVPRPAGIPPTAPDQAARRALSADRADVPPSAADRPDPQPVAPLPRRAPGTNGAPPPPAHVRRNFLPPSLLGRRLDRDAYTGPLPRITGFRAGSFAAPDDAQRAADPVVAPAPPAGAAPLVPVPPDSAPSGSGAAGDTPPDRESAGPAPPGAGPSGPVGPGSGPGAGSSEPEAEGQEEPLFEPSLPAAPAAPTAPAGPASPAWPAPGGSPRYTWPTDPNGRQPGNGAVVPTPADRKQQTSGRRYRIAGLLIAVIALVIAAVVVLLLSGGSGAAGKSQGGLGPPGAGARERNLAAAWVARQVSRTAVVACDAVMGNARAGPDQTSKYSSDSD